MSTDATFDDSGLSMEDQLDAIREEAAELADTDIAARLNRLDELAAARRKNPAIEREYETLRAEMSAWLKEAGPVIYLDAHGNKRIAYRVAPTGVEVNVEELVKAVEAGEAKVDLDVVAPRRVNAEELKKAVATKRIPPKVFLKMAKLQDKTPHVRFTDPDDAR
jgi:microcystin degradation protein MlrC